MTENDFLSTDEVAEILGVNRRTVQRLCNDRKIRHRRTTQKRIEIKREWIDEYLNNVTIQPIIESEENNNGKQ